MFEKASKVKLRFSTSKGYLSVEDLWDLNLTSLDSIAKAVNKDLKASSEESFIATKTGADTILELKLEILKHIISVKLTERDKAKAASDRRAKITELKAIAASKHIEELGSKSLADINRMISDLENEEV